MTQAQPDYSVPVECQETVTRLIFTLQQFLPRFLSRGIDQLSIPAMIKPMVKGMLHDPLKLSVTAAAALVKHPTEDRILTAEELRAWAEELTAAFTWAWGDVTGTSPGPQAKAACEAAVPGMLQRLAEITKE